MNTTPKILARLAKELAYRRYLYRVHTSLGDTVLSQRAAFTARQVKAKLDYIMARHTARATRRQQEAA